MNKKLIAGGLLGSLLFIAGYLAFSWMNQEQTIRPSQDTNAVKSAQMDLKPIVSPYFSTTIPVSFIESTHSHDKQNTILERMMYINKGTTDTVQLAITVGNTPEGGVEGLSDVRIRQNAPDTYSQLELTGGKAISFLAHDAAGQELASFMSHDGRYAALSLSGRPESSQSLQDLMETILSNWQWK